MLLSSFHLPRSSLKRKEYHLRFHDTSVHKGRFLGTCSVCASRILGAKAAGWKLDIPAKRPRSALERAIIGHC